MNIVIQYTYSCGTCSAAWNKQWILLYSTSGCNRAWLWITSRLCRRKLRFQLFGSWIWLSEAHFLCVYKFIVYIIYYSRVMPFTSLLQGYASRQTLISIQSMNSRCAYVCVCVCLCVRVWWLCGILWLWLWLSAFRSPSSSLTPETFHPVFLSASHHHQSTQLWCMWVTWHLLGCNFKAFL